MTAPKADAVSVALDKLERCYADMGLQVTEQETVPAARAEHAALLARVAELEGVVYAGRRSRREVAKERNA